jgi:hypothetical protein
MRTQTIAFDRLRPEPLDTKMRFLIVPITVLILAFMLPGGGRAQSQSDEVTQAKELKAKKTEADVAPVVEPQAEEMVTTTAAVQTTTPRPLEPWDLPVEMDPKVRLKKIYDFLNDKSKTPTGRDEALKYEFKYFDHGAVTEAQKESKKGHYYVVNWATDSAVEALTLRFDYRQKNTRDKVNTVEIPYAQAKGSMKGTFSVTGESYREYGDVISWRISVVRNGKIIAQKKSFVW